MIASARDLAAAHEVLHRDGQVVVRGLVDADTIERYRSIVRSALARSRKVRLPPGNEIYQQAFDQHCNLWCVDPSVEEITLDPDLAAVAAGLLGVAAVRLYHDQALVKVAGGGHTPWHQDQWYWPLDTTLTITMWLPLHDVTPDMGDLEFALGSHAGPIGDEPISGASDDYYERYLADHDTTRRRTGAMRAGDASFHLGWTLHRAAPNESSVDREVMTVIWFADGARVTEPANAGQRVDHAVWLAGIGVGELAAGPLNPVVTGSIPR